MATVNFSVPDDVKVAFDRAFEDQNKSAIIADLMLKAGHWILEVGAVLARVSPETAADDVTLLAALELPATDDPLVVRREAELAVELKQHLSDTFYHAIALCRDALRQLATRLKTHAAKVCEHFVVHGREQRNGKPK